MKSEMEVPEGWKVKKGKETFKIVSGYSPSKINFNSDGNTLFVKVNDLNYLSKGRYVTKANSRFNYEENKTIIFHPKDTIVFPKRGAAIFTNKIGILKYQSAFDTNVMGIITQENFSNLYIFYYLDFLTLSKISDNAGIPQINNKHIYPLELLIPPILEQQKIADILSKVDEQIGHTEKIIDKTEELKKGLMQKLLTKGVGHTKFKKTELGEIPEEWEIVRLSETGDANNSIVAGPFGSNLKVCDYKDQGIPIIRLQNIERNHYVNKDIKYISKEKAEELKYHSFKSGDIVLAKLGDPIGKTCTIPKKLDFGIVVADVVRIRPSEEKADYKFIEFLLNSNYCSKQLSMGTIGSTRPRVNLSDVRNLKIILPPINEQKQIASILSKVDEQIQDNKKELNHLKELKKGLMQDLLTGKVRVTT